MLAQRQRSIRQADSLIAEMRFTARIATTRKSGIDASDLMRDDTCEMHKYRSPLEDESRSAQLSSAQATGVEKGERSSLEME